MPEKIQFIGTPKPDKISRFKLTDGKVVRSVNEHEMMKLLTEEGNSFKTFTLTFHMSDSWGAKDYKFSQLTLLSMLVEEGLVPDLVTVNLRYEGPKRNILDGGPGTIIRIFRDVGYQLDKQATDFGYSVVLHHREVGKEVEKVLLTRTSPLVPKTLRHDKLVSSAGMVSALMNDRYTLLNILTNCYASEDNQAWMIYALRKAHNLDILPESIVLFIRKQSTVISRFDRTDFNLAANDYRKVLAQSGYYIQADSTDDEPCDAPYCAITFRKNVEEHPKSMDEEEGLTDESSDSSPEDDIILGPMRYFLVSVSGNNGLRSIDSDPSDDVYDELLIETLSLKRSLIRDTFIRKFNFIDVVSFCVLNIHEFANEKDYSDYSR